MSNVVRAILLIFFISLGLSSQAQPSDTTTKDTIVTDGPYIEKHENGKVKIEGTYKNGEKHGMWKKYDEKGTLRKATKYKKGKVLTIAEYNEEGKLYRFTNKKGKVKEIEDCHCGDRAN